MKNLLIQFWGWIVLFFTPLLPLMCIISIAVIFDTFVGRWYAKKQNQIITSEKTRKGITSKLIIYLSVITLFFLIDQYMVNEITRKYIWFEFAFTKFWTSFFVWIEYSSINEKVKWSTGKGITDRVKEYIKTLKSIVYTSKDIKDKINR
jgi:hypothetical protein